MKSNAHILPYNLEDLKLTLGSLVAAKLKKHVEILRLESAQKKTELQIILKKNLLERFSLIDTQNIDGVTSELNRINTAIQQLEGRVSSIKAQLNILWDEAIANDSELNLFVKKLETENVRQFLENEIILANSQVINEQHVSLLEHKKEIGLILNSNLHISQKLITMLAEKATYYYKLLEVYNKCTEDKKKSHSTITKSILGGLKAVSCDFSPGNQCKIKRDAFFNFSELSIDSLNVSKKPEFIKPTKLEECMSPLQLVDDKLQHITLQPKNKKIDPSPDIGSDETKKRSLQSESLNNTFMLKQIVNTTKRVIKITPHRNKPAMKPLYQTTVPTKLITKPAIQRKKLIINHNKTGPTIKTNQENVLLAMAASRTLADPILAKAVTKTKNVPSNNILTKSGISFSFGKSKRPCC